MADQFDALKQIACCIHTATNTLLTSDPHLRAPEKGGVTHINLADRAQDFCCDSLWVSLGDTAPSFDNGAPCFDVFTHTFTVLLAIPACSEKKFFQAGKCDEISSGCDPDPDTGCPEPVPRIGTGKCQDPVNKPDLASETDYILRARGLLLSKLSDEVRCCLEGRRGCVAIPGCRNPKMVGMVESTEGGCAFIETTLEVDW